MDILYRFGCQRVEFAVFGNTHTHKSLGIQQDGLTISQYIKYA